MVSSTMWSNDREVTGASKEAPVCSAKKMTKQGKKSLTNSERCANIAKLLARATSEKSPQKNLKKLEKSS